MNALMQYLRVEYGTASLTAKPKQLRDHPTIYVVRLMRSTKGLPPGQSVWMGNSKPCGNCQKYLSKFGFKKIKYTDIIDGVNVLIEMELST
jgi:hypothetical protein